MRRSLGAFTGGRGRGIMASMTEDFDGERIARARIAEEAERRTGFLDLSQLGLTELPAELFALTHLRRLHLGWRLTQREGGWVRADWRGDSNPNRLGANIVRLGTLPNIEALSLSGTDCASLDALVSLVRLTWIDCSHTPVSDLAPLAKLAALQSLDCAFTKVSDLRPLAILATLESLDCSGTRVSDLTPLAMLITLQSLDCHYTQVSDLRPLAKLTTLQRLNCGDTLLGDTVSPLGPLSELTALRSLNCGRTQVSDLLPLVNLTALQELNCGITLVSDLSPLEHLTALQNLDCSYDPISDLSPVANLTALKSLDCDRSGIFDLRPLAKLTVLQSLSFGSTRVTDLSPLAELTGLQSLNFGNTQVVDLRPLANLTALQSLHCWRTQVSDLSPLANLMRLQSLHCGDTQVSDLGPLANLDALQSLNCSSCRLSRVPDAFWHKPSLTKLVLHGSSVLGVPEEVLSHDDRDNCLDSLRAHFRDAAAGAQTITDVKLLVLGNGRSGKTQLARRLADQPFQPDWDSTHGIRVPPAAVLAADRAGAPDGTAARLNIWDFGGQDIYHGTHALFVRSRAVFVLVWATDTEAAKTYEHQGITFRNHPLEYWVDYVRHLAQAESPVVIVQAKCDRAADDRRRAPVPDEAVEALKFCREVHFSAKNGRGRDELEAALRGAIAWLRERDGVAQIGAGRLRVQRRIEGLRNPDGSLPAQWRLMELETFQAWCDEAGGVSSAEHLLAYLHNAGIVFYQKGLFGDRIVLDHAWALNAIYAVFDRTRCYKRLQREGGRFDRLRLEELIWKEQGYTADEQRLFLSMMRSCGICFVYRARAATGSMTTKPSTSRPTCCRAARRWRRTSTTAGAPSRPAGRRCTSIRCCIRA